MTLIASATTRRAVILRVLAHGLASPRPLVLLPMASCVVQAGFPSPADDSFEERLDLNVTLIPRPSSTFLVQGAGPSMSQGPAWIMPGDLLVVDRSLEPVHRSIVVAIVNGEFTLKRWIVHRGRYFLSPDNEEFPSIELTEGMEAMIWGVVTSRVTRFDRR